MDNQQQFYDALCDPQSCPANLKTWNGSDPGKRFAIYRNNVTISLIDALADTFPVTQELVGKEFFRAMAKIFASTTPPRSRILAFYGEKFPQFIETFPPANEVPYLADIARLEMARVRAYHAHDGVELAVETIAKWLTNADLLPTLSTTFHPSVTLLKSPYAIGALWAAHQGVMDIADVDPYVPDSVLVMRHQLDVCVIRLNDGVDVFIEHLWQGETILTAADHALQFNPHFDLVQALSMLISQQAISSINLTHDKSD